MLMEDFVGVLFLFVIVCVVIIVKIIQIQRVAYRRFFSEQADKFCKKFQEKVIVSSFFTVSDDYLEETEVRGKYVGGAKLDGWAVFRLKNTKIRFIQFSRFFSLFRSLFTVNLSSSGFVVELIGKFNISSKVIIYPNDIVEMSPPKIIEGMPKQKKFASSEFERFFDVYAADGVDAHYILDPACVEQFLNLKEKVHVKNMYVVFAQDKVTINFVGDVFFVIPFYNFFEERFFRRRSKQQEAERNFDSTLNFVNYLLNSKVGD